ncbi:MAG: STAS domain-containing protein [Magnetococcales bacterium]|nr:STAS domain-containing protein [Magnetococcales bacterium]
MAHGDGHDQTSQIDKKQPSNPSAKFIATQNADGSIFISVNTHIFNIDCQKDLRKTYLTLPIDRRYILDFDKVKFIDSAGMGLLLMLKEHQSKLDAPIEIINCNKKVLELLQHAKFNLMFIIS